MIGGGDGGALFRALQHDNIEHAALVDIDMRTMREISRKYFSMLHQVIAGRWGGAIGRRRFGLRSGIRVPPCSVLHQAPQWTLGPRIR